MILGLLEEQAGHFAEAARHAARAQVLLPAGRRRELARLTYWLASLQEKAGDSGTAVESLRRLSRSEPPEALPDEATGILGVPAAPDRAALILREGEILAGQGRWGEAASAYARAFDAGIGGNRAAFEYARALTRTGRRDDAKRATGVLERIAGSKQDDFWRKLAREALAGDRTQLTKTAKEGGT